MDSHRPRRSVFERLGPRPRDFQSNHRFNGVHDDFRDRPLGNNRPLQLQTSQTSQISQQSIQLNRRRPLITFSEDQGGHFLKKPRLELTSLHSGSSHYSPQLHIPSSSSPHHRHPPVTLSHFHHSQNSHHSHHHNHSHQLHHREHQDGKTQHQLQSQQQRESSASTLQLSLPGTSATSTSAPASGSSFGKVRLRRRKPRPMDESLDEGEIVDDEDEFEEYTDDDEEQPKVNGQTTGSTLNKPLRLTVNTGLLSPNSHSLKVANQNRRVTSNISNVANSDKADSTYSEWSDDEILLRDDQKKRAKSNGDSRASIVPGEVEDFDESSSGTKTHKLEELEAISDDDFDAFDQDLLERNRDSVEEMLLTEMSAPCNDVSLADIFSINWKCLQTAPPTDDSQLSRQSNPRSCLELLNTVGFSRDYAGSELSSRIDEFLGSNVLNTSSDDNPRPQDRPALPIMGEYYRRHSLHEPFGSFRRNLRSMIKTTYFDSSLTDIDSESMRL